MYVVGSPSIKVRRLIKNAYKSMWAGILQAQLNNTMGDIGHAIETTAKEENFSVVKDFCGHGIGRHVHEPPSVLNTGTPGKGIVLNEGMCFTVEPMVNAGQSAVKILSDGWTAVTRDKTLSAQFEHTILLTKGGIEILTLSLNGQDVPASPDIHQEVMDHLNFTINKYNQIIIK